MRRAQSELNYIPSVQESKISSIGPKYEEYSVVGTFNPITGKFQKEVIMILNDFK